jgi:hypothetical protein
MARRTETTVIVATTPTLNSWEYRGNLIAAINLRLPVGIKLLNGEFVRFTGRPIT